ncbi:MAG: DUF6125 family protein [Candidatus Helarchaeota archaeon]
MHSFKKEDKLLRFFMDNVLNIYNIWFSEVEKQFGLDNAIQISLKVWNKFAKIDGKKISEIFQIPGKDLDEILKLIDIISYLTLAKIEFKKIDENSAYITFSSCYWHKIIERTSKKRLKPLKCNEICIGAYSSFVETFNSDFEVISDMSIPNRAPYCRIIVRKKNTK